MVREGESTLDAARRLALQLNHSVLPIQGPPGSGKTFTGARMIVELIRQGKCVEIAAGSHKVIRKLLEDTADAAIKAGLTVFTALHKVSKKSEEELPAWLTETTKNEEAREALEHRTHAVVAGTAWLWARADFASCVGVAGLRYVPVTHTGNQNCSLEEVDRIVQLVGQLLHPGVTYVNHLSERRPLAPEDILIVAPYNAQVAAIAARLPDLRIGTVDKFQGQEAPIVIYSLTTSSPEDAPRGMEFLYSLNRLNVATSRARALVILVASPHLLEPNCQNPRQMQLASALCRYIELAPTPQLTRTAGD